MTRALLAAALVALQLALCAWWTSLIADGHIGHVGLVERPADHDHQRVVLSLVTVLEVTGTERYRVAEGTLELDVVGPTEGRAPGEELTVIGRWDAGRGAVVAEEVHPAPGRAGKKALGVVGLLALGALLPAWFVPERGGIAVRG